MTFACRSRLTRPIARLAPLRPRDVCASKVQSRRWLRRGEPTAIEGDVRRCERQLSACDRGAAQHRPVDSPKGAAAGPVARVWVGPIARDHHGCADSGALIRRPWPAGLRSRDRVIGWRCHYRVGREVHRRRWQRGRSSLGFRTSRVPNAPMAKPGNQSDVLVGPFLQE